MMTDLSFLQACRTPRLFVQGERDQFGGADLLRELVARLPEPRSLVIVPGADHFFGDHLDEMQEAVGAWAAERPWAAA
jgi:alpha/beta superfamily hydrolase